MHVWKKCNMLWNWKLMRLISTVWSSLKWTETSVGTGDTCPQGSLSVLEHEVEVAVGVTVYLLFSTHIKGWIGVCWPCEHRTQHPFCIRTDGRPGHVLRPHQPDTALLAPWHWDRQHVRHRPMLRELGWEGEGDDASREDWQDNASRRICHHCHVGDWLCSFCDWWIKCKDFKRFFYRGVLPEHVLYSLPALYCDIYIIIRIDEELKVVQIC